MVSEDRDMLLEGARGQEFVGEAHGAGEGMSRGNMSGVRGEQLSVSPWMQS